MENLYGRIEGLCKQRGVTVGKMCAETGLSRGNLTDLKMGRIKSLKADNLAKIAEYLGTTVDALLGTESTYQQKNAPPNQEDVGVLLDTVLATLGAEGSVMFNGQILDDSAKELLLASLESNIRLTDELSRRARGKTGKKGRNDS